MTACTQLSAEELVVSGHSHESEEDAALYTLVNDIVDKALEHSDLGPFLTYFRARGPDLREAVETLASRRPPPDEDSPQDDSGADELVPRLASVGVIERRLDYVEHAARTWSRAHAVAHMLQEHGRPLIGAAIEHSQEAERESWMYTFARIALWRVAVGTVPPDAPAVGFAVQLAVESARNCYAQFATAMDSVAA